MMDKRTFIKIFGWLSGVAATVIAGLAVGWFTKDHPRPLSPASLAGLFVGSWMNVNSSTGGVTRVEIHQHLNKLAIHAWVKAHPADTDLGVQDVAIADIRDRTIATERTWPFKTESIQWVLLPDDRLEVSKHTHFTDNSGRPDYDSSNYFKRQ